MPDGPRVGPGTPGYDATPLESGRIYDSGEPSANMYGCIPCPKCRSIYRVPYANYMASGQNNVIVCEECHFIEPITGAAAE